MKCNGPKRKQPQRKPKTGPQSRIHPPSAAPKGRGQKLPHTAPRCDVNSQSTSQNIAQL